MSEETEVNTAPVEDWEAVWARARARVAGLREIEGPVVQTELELPGLIDRFMARAERLPQDLPPAEPEKPRLSAEQVRMSWYIPKRHVDDTLENFRPLTDEQATALQATRLWVDSVKDGEGGTLALIGEVGSGKSHLLYAAVRDLNLSGIHAAAAGWYDLADLFRQAKYGHDEDITEARIRKSRYLAAAALAIDEIRPTSGTDYDTTELSQLMTRAYRERQGVIVTSNYADEKLSRIIGLAASSRLTQVIVKGPDLRKPENRHLRAS